MNIGPMLNLYPDSLGGTLDDVVDFLKTEGQREHFLPAIFCPVCTIRIWTEAFL